MKSFDPPTPEEIERAKALVLKYWPFISNFQDDLKELLFQAKQPDPKGFERVMMRLIQQIDVFVGLDETQFLNKEIRDVTSHPAKPRGAVRGNAHVVPSKAEERRRDLPGQRKHPLDLRTVDTHDLDGDSNLPFLDDDVPF